MYNENQINVIKIDKVDSIRSSIEGLKDKLFINDLKKDLQEFIDTNVELDKSNNHLKIPTIKEAPSWFPKANLSKTQTDLIATSVDGEEFIFFDYFTNHRLPSIQTENGLNFLGGLVKNLAGSFAKAQYVQASLDGE